MTVKRPSDRAHIIVVGGGVIGAAAAVRLQDIGAHVTLVDPGEAAARASFGNAGIIANELADPLASWSTVHAAPGRLFGAGGPLDFVAGDIGLWGPWALRFLAACRADRFRAGRTAIEALLVDAAPAWRRLAADMGRPELLQSRPHWAVWETEASLQTGAAAVAANACAAVRVRNLDAEEAATVRKAVSHAFVGGVAFEGSARVTDPNAVTSALHERLRAAGGEVIVGRARRIETGETGAAAELDDGRRVTSDMILVAVGARSAPLVRPAGLIAPLVAERGYHLQYADHDLSADVPSLVLEDRFICVVRIGDAVRVTGFTEIGSPDSAPDPRKWARLRRHVAELGLPVRGEPSQWMGARPTLPDFVPAIGRWGRLLYAFGHQHIGVTLAAVTAEAVAELAESGGTPERLRAYDLRRFR
jgi:glycine/D-amino acid oxidase-like deaminating enzyme